MVLEHVCRMWTRNPKVKVGNTFIYETAKILIQIQSEGMVMVDQPDIVMVTLVLS